MRMRAAVVLALAALLAACAPRYGDWGDGPSGPPRLALPAGAATGSLHTADGLTLPLRAWGPGADPRAVLLALHGFNDYGQAFAEAGRWLADHGIAVYALDQRGFGAGPRAGHWAGTAALTDDVRTMVALLRQRHPGLPLYVLGESMGGAVVMAALARPDAPRVAGAILSAPAVWGLSTMPWYQRLLLEAAVRVAPTLTVSGRGLGIWPTDNMEMLYVLSRDPLVLKETRLDAIYGLSLLMDDAYGLARDGRLPGPVLWLYGARDEIIPPGQTLTAARGLDPDDDQRFVAYPQGYHMLLRDLQGETVLRDILAWMTAPESLLPSGLPSGLSVDPATITIPPAPRRGARAPGRIDPRPKM